MTDPSIGKPTSITDPTPPSPTGAGDAAQTQMPPAPHPDAELWDRLLRTLARGVLTLVYVLLFEVMNYVIFALAFFQYLVVLVTGKPLAALHPLNERLAAYVGDISGYLTCLDERPPFPFSRLRAARGLPARPEWRRRERLKPPRQ